MKLQNRARSQTFPWTIYVLLFAYIGVSFSYQIISSVAFLTTYFHGRQQVQAPFQLDSETDAITSTTQAAARAGLRIGDRLESINDVPYYGQAQWQGTQWHARAGDIIRLGVRRDDGTHTVLLLPFEAHSPPVSIGEAVFLVFMQVALPLFCLTLGSWVALARPLDLNAWFVLLLLSYPEAFISVSSSQWWPGIWLVLRLYWHLFLETAAPVALLWLGLLFPERLRLDLRLPWLKWCVLALVGGGLTAELLVEYGKWYNHQLFAHRAQIDTAVSSILKWTFVLCVLFYWISLFDKLRTAASADARRRLRVLGTGSAIGLGSMLLIFGGLPWLGVTDPGSIHWLDVLAALLMLTFPLSLAYVVIVQRAMDVHLLLRMGTKYALARTTLVVFELCVALFVFFYFISPAMHSPRQGVLDYMISAFAIAALIWMFAARGSISARLQHWLDRQFFREAYNAELVLSGLAARVRTITDRSTLLDTVSHRISEVLHIEQVAALLRSGEGFRLEHGVGIPMNDLASLPAPSLRLNSSSPIVVYQLNKNPFLAESNGGGQPILETTNAEVILPLPGRSKLMGLLMLGPKRSEEPYSPSDLRLLESVGVQTGLSLEISELAHSLTEEAAQRERMQRELEVAQEVQERLFPQNIPAVTGLDLAGHYRPAFGVGGDYYDIFKLAEGRIALAIGDVSGKGISAALLMAGLRAALRSLAEENANDLGRLMSKLNRHVYEASAANRYATFFFAIFAPSSGKLLYVNAGHNPPFVIRQASVTLRLETGGTVVGLLPESAYVEGTIQLQPGDVFLAYTDGISEAMTIDGEEWGEQQIVASAVAYREHGAHEILQQLMEAADEFTAGAPQHDDMTLLIMKLLPV